MIHCYDIKTSVDFFRKLLDEREDFLKNPSSARHGINCAVTAWQLHDWVYAERMKYPFMNRFPLKKDFRDYLYKADADFKTLHDLADGAKHYELTHRTTSILNTKISNWRALRKGKNTDDAPQLFLTMEFGNVGMTMSFDDLLYLTTLFWYHFFRDELKENVEKILLDGYTLF